MRPDDITALETRYRSLEAENVELRRQLSDVQSASASLSETASRYQTLFNNMDEGFCVIEFLDGPHGPLSDYIHVQANPAYARHAGIENVVGQKVRDMVPDEADGWVKLYGGVLADGKPIRFQRELVATGRFLELSAFRIEPASRREVAVLFQDITRRKRAETELQSLNETLEMRVIEALAERKILLDMIEGTNAFVQVVDMNFRWMAINQAATNEFARIFGVMPQRGDNMIDLLAEQPEQQAAVKAVWQRALNGEEFVEVSEFGDPSRDRRCYEMRFSPLKDSNGKQIGAYQFVYDVTDRLREQEQLRKAEDALRQAQKMEAVGQLTGGIAHDFNNMLAIVIGSLNLLERRLADGDARSRRYVTAATDGARRAALLTQRLLSFSRQQPLRPEAIDANKLVADMSELLRHSLGSSIELETVLGAGLWRTSADPNQLENVIINLAVNARDAMPDGGKLTIETQNAYLDERYVAEHVGVQPGQYVLIAVTDSGFGMSRDVIGKAFDPFFTTKDVGKGTGLGLSQVYGFVRQTGGHVKIYSEPDNGTTVKIYLPRLFGNADDTPAKLPGYQVPAGEQQELVLVVEDEAAVRQFTTDALEELGYRVLEAASAEDALRLLDAHPDIDLLFTDVVMPRINGAKLAAEARRLRPALKVLFTTGYTRNAIVHNGILDGGVNLISKPFTVEELGDRLRSVLDAPSA